MEIEIEISSCRICFKNTGIVPIFKQLEDDTVAEMISSLCNVIVVHDIDLPDTVCTICLENIKSAINTKDTIINSEIMLNTYLEINNKIVEPIGNVLENNDGNTEITSKLIGLDVEQLVFENFEDEHLNSSDSESTKFMDNEDTTSHVEYEVLENNKPQLFAALPKIYDCEKCEFKTDTYKRLIIHMKSHKDLKLYECEQCGKEYKVKSKYLSHALVHSLDTRYKCNYCKKGFKAQSYLDQHLLTHRTERNITCSYCYKTFCHLKGLRAHLLSHNEKNVVCEICGKAFKHTTFLKIHNAAKHVHIDGPRRINKTNKRIVKLSSSQKLKRQVSCEFCGKILSIQAIKNHIRNTHFQEKRFKCSYCDKVFFSSASLNLHMQYHINNSKNSSLDPKALELYLKYKCDECDKAFTSFVFLKKHKIQHSGLKEYLCLHCGKQFAFKVYLNRHVRLNHDRTNPKNFVCEICGKVSLDLAALKAHMLAHTGETPFHCKFCDAKFKYAKSLRIHVRNKHDPVNSCKESSKGILE